MRVPYSVSGYYLVTAVILCPSKHETNGESEIGNIKDPVFYLHVFVINIDAVLLDEDGIQILENRSEPQKRSTCRARMPFGL